MGERDQAQLQTQQDKGGFTANEQSEGGQWMEKYQKETSRVGGFLLNYETNLVRFLLKTGQSD